jgi:hypothetical protein
MDSGGAEAARGIKRTMMPSPDVPVSSLRSPDACAATKLTGVGVLQAPTLSAATGRNISIERFIGNPLEAAKPYRSDAAKTPARFAKVAVGAGTA